MILLDSGELFNTRTGGVFPGKMESAPVSLRGLHQISRDGGLWDLAETRKKLGVAEVSQAPRAVRNTEISTEMRESGVISHVSRESHADGAGSFKGHHLCRTGGGVMMFDIPSLAVSLVLRLSFGIILTGRFWEEPQPAERVPRRVPGGQRGVSSCCRPWC